MVDPFSGVPTNVRAGNVQVLEGGKWWFWNSILFSVSATRVACRQLGFSKPLNFRTIHNLTNVMGNVLDVGYMKCTGNENKLSDCLHGNRSLFNKTSGFSLVWVKCGKLMSLTHCSCLSSRIILSYEFLGYLISVNFNFYTEPVPTPVQCDAKCKYLSKMSFL